MTPRKPSTPPKDTPLDEPAAEPEVILPPPTNVIAALARVQAEVGGIEKLTPEQRRARTGQTSDGDDRGVKYAFRSIDQITAAAQPLFGKYGIVIVPERIIELAVAEITVNSKPWTDTSIQVHWRIYGPGGVEDAVSAHTAGLGRDNSDKGMNKATTSAYKNLVLRLLCIGDPDEDPDHERQEADARQPAQRRRQQQRGPVDPEAKRVYDAVVAAAGDAVVAAELSTFREEHGNGRKFVIADLTDPEWRGLVEGALAQALDPAADGDALADAFDPDVADVGLDAHEGYGA